MKTYLTPAWLLLTAAAALHLAATTPYAATERVKPGYVACISAQHLELFNTATHRSQIELMMQSDCLPTERLAEHPFTQLDDTGRIRVYLPDDQYADLYVAPVALPEV